jgi:protein Jumonji
LKDSNEPTMFSLERLLLSLSEDGRCSSDVLMLALPLLRATVEREERNREALKAVGLRSSERLPLPDSSSSKKAKPGKEDDTEYECEVCRANLHLSLVRVRILGFRVEKFNFCCFQVTNSQEEVVYCLPHAIAHLNKKKHHLKYSKLLYTYDLVSFKFLSFFFELVFCFIDLNQILLFRVPG